MRHLIIRHTVLRSGTRWRPWWLYHRFLIFLFLLLLSPFLGIAPLLWHGGSLCWAKQTWEPQHLPRAELWKQICDCFAIMSGELATFTQEFWNGNKKTSLWHTLEFRSVAVLTMLCLKHSITTEDGSSHLHAQITGRHYVCFNVHQISAVGTISR